MSHFYASDEEYNDSVTEQSDTFKKAIEGIKAPMSLANSAAILSYPNTHVDYVRPGIMLYGASPFVHKSAVNLGLKPAMQFVSRVIALHNVKKGDVVGYGGIWRAEKESSIAVVAAGYGDGYPRVVSGARVFIKGEFAPIVGRVSMDMLTIDVTGMPVQLGDDVELWGQHVLVDEVARAANTIGYELLCKVTSRVSKL